MHEFYFHSGKSETALLHSSTQQRLNVLLKTAVTQVSSQEKCKTTTNILFDEGAQRLFITEKLANKLKIKHTGLDTIEVASFGGKPEQCCCILTGKVFLHVEHGEAIPLHDVLIVPSIAIPLLNLQ